MWNVKKSDYRVGTTALETSPTKVTDSEVDPQNHGGVRGFSFAFVGRLNGLNRREATEMIRQKGGDVVDVDDPQVDFLVVSESNLPPSDRTILDKRPERVEILSETELWSRLGLLGEPGDPPGQLYTLSILSQILSVSPVTLRRWHRRGLLRSCRQVNRLPYFDFTQLVTARTLCRLMADHSGDGIVEVRLARLADTPDHSLLDLDVVIDGRSVMLRQGTGLIDVDGQRRLDFYADPGVASADSTISLPMIASTGSLAERTADQLLQIALEREDLQDFPGAIDAYRGLLEACGPTADVCFALAELLYLTGQLPAARERYLMSIELEETFVEARANLACLLVEMGEFAAARSQFERALDVHRDYPDVHFHLAKLLDQMSESDVAEYHWRRFVELAPNTPWSSEARSRLQGWPPSAP